MDPLGYHLVDPQLLWQCYMYDFKLNLKMPFLFQTDQLSSDFSALPLFTPYVPTKRLFKTKFEEV